VTVATTPNGYADAITDGRFMKPAEELIPFSDFLDILEGHKQINGIAYIQKQNSNFMDEFSALADEVELDIPWATEALGNSRQFILLLFCCCGCKADFDLMSLK
jgi:jumonji domain-containing protein 7